MDRDISSMMQMMMNPMGNVMVNEKDESLASSSSFSTNDKEQLTQCNNSLNHMKKSSNHSGIVQNSSSCTIPQAQPNSQLQQRLIQPIFPSLFNSTTETKNMATLSSYQNHIFSSSSYQNDVVMMSNNNNNINKQQPLSDNDLFIEDPAFLLAECFWDYPPSLSLQYPQANFRGPTTTTLASTANVANVPNTATSIHMFAAQQQALAANSTMFGEEPQVLDLSCFDHTPGMLFEDETYLSLKRQSPFSQQFSERMPKKQMTEQKSKAMLSPSSASSSSTNTSGMCSSPSFVVKEEPIIGGMNIDVFKPVTSTNNTNATTSSNTISSTAASYLFPMIARTSSTAPSSKKRSYTPCNESVITTTPTQKNMMWSEEEDRILIEAVNEFGPCNWRVIADRIPQRTQMQCSQRYKLLTSNHSKGKFTSEEDELLTEFIESKTGQDGNSDECEMNLGFYDEIAKKLNRTSKQCRDRWQTILSQDKQVPFTETIDRTILELHSQLGNKWKAIADQIPGVNFNRVKSRYKSLVHKMKPKSMESA